MLPSRYTAVIHPSGPLGGYVQAPPSKNYTTRLLLGAALAEGRSLIRRPATNDDARALVACLRALGAQIEETGPDLTVRGFASRPRNPGRINPGNAGAVLRLLLAVACLVEGEVEFVTDHTDSLGRRPNEDLLAALRQLGADAAGQGSDGRLPIRIAGGPQRVRGGAVKVSGARSSQFLSALLFLAPHLTGDTTIEVTGADATAPPVLVSRPLIDQTLDAMRRFGLRCDPDPSGFRFLVPGGQVGRAGDHAVNGDWPSAAALMAAVAVAGGMSTIHGLQDDAQGERRAERLLAAMGCTFVRPEEHALVIHSKGNLQAADLDGDLATDAVLALIGAACLADGTSRFSNIGNLRLKECDRIREPLEELARLGVRARHGEDWIEIDGNPDGYDGGVDVDSRGDHRVAQMLAIVGLRCRNGLRITRAESVSKSYPDFFADLQRMGVKLDLVPASD
ncbi:MAG TPA: 3-phosphoshikimate 1-carboxyvinyltransferase [Candidatus Sumerlaeota bacterium]|nr:3-phosphoshikimate 1-carboxyvinyltransferase [Candidatus Sumerlaeota bacterium]